MRIEDDEKVLDCIEVLARHLIQRTVTGLCPSHVFGATTPTVTQLHPFFESPAHVFGSTLQGRTAHCLKKVCGNEGLETQMSRAQCMFLLFMVILLLDLQLPGPVLDQIQLLQRSLPPFDRPVTACFQLTTPVSTVDLTTC